MKEEKNNYNKIIIPTRNKIKYKTLKFMRKYSFAISFILSPLRQTNLSHNIFYLELKLQLQFLKL